MVTATAEERTNSIDNTAAMVLTGTAITTRATATRRIRPPHMSAVLPVSVSHNQGIGGHDNYTAQTGTTNTLRTTGTCCIYCVSGQLIRQSSAIVTERNAIPIKIA